MAWFYAKLPSFLTCRLPKCQRGVCREGGWHGKDGVGRGDFLFIWEKDVFPILQLKGLGCQHICKKRLSVLTPQVKELRGYILESLVWQIMNMIMVILCRIVQIIEYLCRHILLDADLCMDIYCVFLSIMMISTANLILYSDGLWCNWLWFTVYMHIGNIDRTISRMPHRIREGCHSLLYSWLPLNWHCLS